MPANKTGGYVDASDAPVRDRASLYIMVQPNSPVIILPKGGSRIVPGGVGFAHTDALDIKRDFTAALFEVSQNLDQRHAAAPPALPDSSDPSYDEKLETALTLTEGETKLALLKLRSCGRAFRSTLNKEMEKALKDFGFPQEEMLKEPALTFANHEAAPILWDMMYEEETVDADLNWESFWGFRVPITHWASSVSRHTEIRLKKGLFSAVDDTLKYAASELTHLADQLTSDLSHRRLSDEVKERARQALCGYIEGAQVDTWFEAQAATCWLRNFLEKLILESKADEEAMATFVTSDWKEKTVRRIFTDPHFAYELVHFACHSEPGALSELTKPLNINIAGAEMSVNVASMTNQREWSYEEPGPLVFLNACGTAQQGVTNQPPGFPDTWIKKNGAIAVVATLCPVPDLFAHAFALKFYHLLFSSAANARYRYLGEVLLETRRYFMEKCGNPLGLAYVLYAAQDVRLET